MRSTRSTEAPRPPESRHFPFQMGTSAGYGRLVLAPSSSGRRSAPERVIGRSRLSLPVVCAVPPLRSAGPCPVSTAMTMRRRSGRRHGRLVRRSGMSPGSPRRGGDSVWASSGSRYAGSTMVSYSSRTKTRSKPPIPMDSILLAVRRYYRRPLSYREAATCSPSLVAWSMPPRGPLAPEDRSEHPQASLWSAP